ncbi:hypothetical protein Cgig2_002356 [Carnegiea gigantea]|uniref:Protein PAIR1 n=1 Tax=Carnegiea gigantea TaxID=171969 RepID=A0A9Q1JYX8_9CARY|nr:hypothetical protein Cgig2_002356 [Carnegiea gigantea]
MKLKINKACDLNSISVLPPHNRRSSIVAVQQPRSQPSQQSFSQGISSQHNGICSQISQNSLDDTLLDNQRFGSQEKDNSLRRVSCLAPVSHPREDSQVPVSRSSSSLTRRWSSATVLDHKCQLSDELEHRITTMETSLSKFGMILDSIQADVMQANKGTKELSLEVEGIRQKSTAHDDSLHLLNRGQEDIRAMLDVGLKSINEQLSKVVQQEHLQQILSGVSSLPGRVDTSIQKHDEELYKCLSGDLRAWKLHFCHALWLINAIACSLKTLNQKNIPLAILPPKVTGAESSSQNPFLRRKAEPAKVFTQARVPKVEMGSWTTVKAEKFTSPYGCGNSCKNLKQRRTSPMVRGHKVLIELDESDEDLSCFIVENESAKHMVDEVNEATQRILRKARRRKRKESCKRTFQT